MLPKQPLRSTLNKVNCYKGIVFKSLCMSTKDKYNFHKELIFSAVYKVGTYRIKISIISRTAKQLYNRGN